MPLVRTTLAPRGRTPTLGHRARHRDKVSVAGALTLSPGRGRIGLHCLTCPGAHVDGYVYSLFLRRVLLRAVRGPVVLLHDRGQMHRGPDVAAVLAEHPRLTVEPLPAYAPELNPVEGVWNLSKDKDLANFVPQDLPQLHDAVCDCLREVRHDQRRLLSCYLATELSWEGTTLSI